jgi:hypothetical protein
VIDLGWVDGKRARRWVCGAAEREVLAKLAYASMPERMFALVGLAWEPVSGIEPLTCRLQVGGGAQAGQPKRCSRRQ